MQDWDLVIKNISGKIALVIVLTDCFAQKNVDDTVIFFTIFITDVNLVRSITDNIVPHQSGSVFYERAKLTSVQYKHIWMVIIELYIG